MLRRATARYAPLLRHSQPQRALSTRRTKLHQPLGTVPAGTDAAAVRDKFGSNAMDLIQAADTVEVDGAVAVCDGGGGALGHPLEYIKILVADGADAGPQICKYCGTKFVRKSGATGGH